MTRDLRDLDGRRITRDTVTTIRQAAEDAPEGSDHIAHAAEVAHVDLWVARSVLSGQPWGES